MSFVIDKENRKIIITKEKTKDIIEIKENEKIQRKFLDDTVEKYECILKLLDINIINEETQEPTGDKITKAFAQKVDDESWLIEFNEEEFIV